MKILDKYISRHFLALLISANLISMLIYLLAGILDRLNYMMIKKGLSLAQIISYFLYQVPQLYYYCAPLSVIFALLLTLGILSQRNELTIIRGAGYSWWQIARIPLIYTLIYAWIMYLVGGWLIPFSNQKVKEFEFKEIKKQAEMPITNLWLFNRKDENHQYAIWVGLYLPQENRIKNLKVYLLNSDFFPMSQLRAKKAQYLGKGKWRLEKVKIFKYHPFAPPELKTRRMLERKLPLKPEGLISFQKFPEELSIGELKKYIQQLKAFGLASREFLVELNSRYSLPFACLVLFGLGVGIALRIQKPRGIYLNLGWALFFCFAYFAVMAMSLSLGKSGKMPAFLSAWLANFLFGAVSGYLILKR